ncbi:MAG: cell division inhibitor [Acidobacteria bacterium]|nr:cell division inhibitor [Acidobacteriota bacterium]
MIFEKTTIINAPLADIFRFFGEPQNLARITPPEMRFRVTNGPDRPLREDDRIEYELRLAGIPVRWRTRIATWRDNESFSDFQERGPYKRWLHTHTFREVAGGVEMHDHVDYELPLGWLGRAVAGWWVRRELARIFAHRAKVIRETFG